MFTPVARKYSKETPPPSTLRYSKDRRIAPGKYSIHKQPSSLSTASNASSFVLDRKADTFKSSTKENAGSRSGIGVFDLAAELECFPQDSGSWTPGLGYVAKELKDHFGYSGRSGGYAEKSSGNQLLALRAELSEKELQLVEIQQQHNKLICRSTEAFKRLEGAIRTKDQVIFQLHQALQNKHDELQRQEKLFEENKEAVLRTLQGQKDSELEQKEAEIAFLNAKMAEQMRELELRDHANADLRQRLLEEGQAPQHTLNRMDALIAQVKCLESSLHNKEAEIESQVQLCTELKSLLRKRESMITQLQLAEQQLQSALTRQTEAYNALEAANNKLVEDKSQTETNMTKLMQDLECLNSTALNDHQLKGELQVQEACLFSQRKQIQDLQRALHAKDVALCSQSKKLHMQLEENQKLIEDLELLKQEFAALKLEKQELEMNLNNQPSQLAAKRMPAYGFPQHNSINQDTLPGSNEIIEVCNWRKQEATEAKPAPNPATPQRASKKREARQPGSVSISSDNELSAIEEEIGRREKEWRHTEAKMRAELCRRLAQLSELETLGKDLPGKPEKSAPPRRSRS